jgi:hypothetical protein
MIRQFMDDSSKKGSKEFKVSYIRRAEETAKNKAKEKGMKNRRSEESNKNKDKEKK